MKKNPLDSRREILKTLGLLSVSVPIVGVVGCGSSSDNDAEDNNGIDDGASTVDTTVPWVSGSTDLIIDDYPSDALFASATSCAIALTSPLTAGPCYFYVNEREDISEGFTGLPMMLCLQVIDELCNPVEGVVVEIWHCDKSGVYSADTNGSSDSSGFATSFCSGGEEDALNAKWFRGGLLTDSNGRVNFKSCFPGWYPGRTIHIHFRVRNDSDYVISQFCFDDGFCDDICTTHPEYIDRGAQSTPLSSGRDSVFRANGDEFKLNLKQNSDGTLLAYKKIQISV